MAVGEHATQQTFGAAIERLTLARGVQIAKLALVRTAWFSLLLALALIAADMFLAFEDRTRLYLDLCYVAAIIAAGVFTLWNQHRAVSRSRMLTRMIEEKHPELQNALINAVDFSDQLDRDKHRKITADLMYRAICDAQARLDELPDLKALRPPSLKREVYVLLALAGTTIVLAVAAFHVFSAIVPRYVLPFGDYPPYCATRFDVQPAGTTVDYGDNQKIVVTTSGRLPESVSLVLRSLDGVELAAFPMFASNEGIFFQTIENVQDDVDYFARTGRGRSKRYRLSTAKLPKIESVVAAYAYPDYTRRKPETRLLKDYDLSGYVSTQVTLTVQSNRPLQGGEIQVCGVTHQFRPAKGGTVAATFPMLEEGTFSAQVVDVDNNTSPEELAGSIKLIPDEKPSVTMVSPGMDSFAIPDSEVPIVVEAQDDLGITRIELFRNHNDSTDMKKALYLGDGGESVVEAIEVLDLKGLGVRPGDTIDYYATAIDSKPGAPQTAATASFRLQIISFEEYREFVQSQTTATDLAEKYDSMLEEIEALTEAQEALHKEVDEIRDGVEAPGEMSDADRERLEKAQIRQRKLAEIAQELADFMKQEAEAPAIYDIEEEYKEALKEFAERLAQASMNMEQADREMGEAGQQADSESPGNPSMSMARASEEQKKALEQLKQSEAQFKEGIQKPNEDLTKVIAVMGDVEIFKHLYTLQQGFERQIRYYKDMPNPGLDDSIRLKELAEQQQTVEQALTELKESLRLHADELDKLDAEQQLSEQGDSQ